jgi:hypothetical protein
MCQKMERSSVSTPRPEEVKPAAGKTPEGTPLQMDLTKLSDCL